MSQSEYFELNLRFKLTILVTDYQILIEHVLRLNSHPLELDPFARTNFPKLIRTDFLNVADEFVEKSPSLYDVYFI